MMYNIYLHNIVKYMYSCRRWKYVHTKARIMYRPRGLRAGTRTYSFFCAVVLGKGIVK